MDDQVIIEQVKKWVDDVIIAHQFCPFAKQEFSNNKIQYKVINVSEIEEVAFEILEEVKRFCLDHSYTTSLLVLNNGFKDFNHYLDLYDLAVALINDQGFEGKIQLASFHPNYCFEGELPSDASNYTNKSPYPIIHILDENLMEEALINFPSPELIPERNIEHAKKLGTQYFKKLLNEITQS